MIPTILEIYVLWHPQDTRGEEIAAWLLEHFHGTTYSGLIGGAVEVYTRSEGWDKNHGPPRPMPFMRALPHGLAPPRVTAVVPVLGTNLARAAENSTAWRDYLTHMAGGSNESVGVFPLRLDPEATSGTTLSSMLPTQALAAACATDRPTLARDLAQSIAQLIGDPLGNRLQVFISHTKRQSPDEGPDHVEELIHHVRTVIGSTHLRAFFDEADIQPGEDWCARLKDESARSGLLMLRTDRYASRTWCQREVIVAKRAEMPIVALSALTSGEERGSFVMDHVPTVPLDGTNGDTTRASIEVALNQLVDEALKRALWRLQRSLLEDSGFDWLPVHAPEPVTITPWALNRLDRGDSDGHLFILHPDPPLGPEEEKMLKEVLALGGLGSRFDVLTPRTFASRGGRIGHE